MRKFVVLILRKIYLYDFFVNFFQNLRITKREISWHYKRRFGHVDREIIENYLAKQEIRKLHIGCGGTILSGWLNSDLCPYSDNILHLDATTTFPFKDDTFDFIFGEHMIEHISYSSGFTMLSECHRVLKNNGKTRISTPNLQFLIDLYGNSKSELQSEYIKWATDSFIKSAPYYDDTFVINNFVRDWEHLFIYDEKTLRALMEKVGFSEITRFDLNNSEEELLLNLENNERIPKGFLKLESFTLEGTKLHNS